LTRNFPGSALHATSVNGRIMLSGHVSDAATLDKAVTIARQFGPEIINSVTVDSPQQVLLEVRFIELSRTAGRELGVQWNRVGGNSLTNIGNNQPASSLPITASNNSLASGTEVAAGVLSGGTPFGFMIGRLVASGVSTDVMINALEQKGVARSLAEPGGAVGRHRELPRRRRISNPGVRLARPGHRRLQEIRRRPRLHADRA